VDDCYRPRPVKADPPPRSVRKRGLDSALFETFVKMVEQPRERWADQPPQHAAAIGEP
jgi:hypothetical protein